MMRSKRSLTRNVGNRADHINRISMREYQHSGGDKNNSSNSQFLYVDENNSYDDNSPRSNKTTDLIESKYDSHSNVVTCDGCTVTSVDSNTESWLQSRNTNSSFNELSLHQGEKKNLAIHFLWLNLVKIPIRLKITKKLKLPCILFVIYVFTMEMWWKLIGY